ncbi:hypothetical protein SHIRM173S_11249 [Streptomyces hirsutus]
MLTSLTVEPARTDVDAGTSVDVVGQVFVVGGSGLAEDVADRAGPRGLGGERRTTARGQVLWGAT